MTREVDGEGGDAEGEHRRIPGVGIEARSVQQRHLRGREGGGDRIPVLQSADGAAVVEEVRETAHGRDGVDAELGRLVGEEGELIHPAIVPRSALAAVVAHPS